MEAELRLRLFFWRISGGLFLEEKKRAILDSPETAGGESNAPARRSGSRGGGLLGEEAGLAEGEQGAGLLRERPGRIGKEKRSGSAALEGEQERRGEGFESRGAERLESALDGDGDYESGGLAGAPRNARHPPSGSVGGGMDRAAGEALRIGNPRKRKEDAGDRPRRRGRRSEGAHLEKADAGEPRIGGEGFRRGWHGFGSRRMERIIVP